MLESVIFTCMGIQIMAFFARPDKGSKILKYWNWYHYWFGRIALFFGNINIVLEIQIGKTGNGMEGRLWISSGYCFDCNYCFRSVVEEKKIGEGREPSSFPDEHTSVRAFKNFDQRSSLSLSLSLSGLTSMENRCEIEFDYTI